MLGFLFFMLFLAGFALVFLKGRQVESQPAVIAAEQSFHDIDWRPESIDDKNVPATSEAILRFASDGNIGGHGGCNRFFGSWEYLADGVRIGPLGATRMACPEPIMSLETAFLLAIENTKSVSIAGEQLSLLDADENVLAVLVAAGTNNE